MSEQRHTYQAMFLLDNQEVRQGFTAARDWVQATLEKHGLDVKVLRLWGERPLAYKIRGRRRATYLLGWLEGSGESVNKVKREMYLLGPVFRCLFLQEEGIPEEELAYGVEDVDESALVIPEDEPEPDFEDYVEPENSEDDSDGPPRGKAKEEESEGERGPRAKVAATAADEEEDKDDE